MPKQVKIQRSLRIKHKSDGAEPYKYKVSVGSILKPLNHRRKKTTEQKESEKQKVDQISEFWVNDPKWCHKKHKAIKHFLCFLAWCTFPFIFFQNK